MDGAALGLGFVQDCAVLIRLTPPLAALLPLRSAPPFNRVLLCTIAARSVQTNGRAIAIPDSRRFSGCCSSTWVQPRF